MKILNVRPLVVTLAMLLFASLLMSPSAYAVLPCPDDGSEICEEEEEEEEG